MDLKPIIVVKSAEKVSLNQASKAIRKFLSNNTSSTSKSTPTLDLTLTPNIDNNEEIVEKLQTILNEISKYEQTKPPETPMASKVVPSSEVKSSKKHKRKSEAVEVATPSEQSSKKKSKKSSS